MKLPTAMLRRQLSSSVPLRLLRRLPEFWRGFAAWGDDRSWRGGSPSPPSDSSNSLRAFFESRKEGHGIWKWDHYFDIYDRHFRRFCGKDSHVLEIGVFSGGSLDMWRHYFGPESHIYGADVRPECKEYESALTKIVIGDQGDRAFWKQFKERTPALDIVIDDGSHRTEDQIVTFEELFPFLRPGGVYLCEDTFGSFNGFAMYAQGFAHRLSEYGGMKTDADSPARRLTCTTTALQSAVGSVHLYPFVVVIERRHVPVAELRAPMHGTQWQPWGGGGPNEGSADGVSLAK
jgi:hypothetical protein